MKKIGYFALRRQIFVYELKHMLRQIEHLVLFVIAFLGTAIPVLFFLSFLAFGIILDNDSSTSQLLFIVWALVMTQSMLLLLAKQAILGSRYRYYLTNLERGFGKRLLADSMLALTCSPILLLYVFVLVSIAPGYWIKIPHGFLLLLLLLGTFVCLYKPQGLFWFLGLTLCCIPLLSSQSLVLALICFCIIQVLIILVFMVCKSNFSSFYIALPIEWMFWLSLSVGSYAGLSQTSGSGQKPNSLLSVCAISILLIIMTHYSAAHLPEFISNVNFIGAQLIVLASASLQLSTHKIIHTYPLFFASYLSNPSIAKRQYWVSIATTFILLLVAAFVLSRFIVLLHLLSALLCIYSAKRAPKFFIATWLISSLCLALLIFTAS